MKALDIIKKTVFFISVSICFGFSNISMGGEVVVVHPSNENNLTKKDIQRIFLGKSKKYPDGSEIIPLDLLKDSPKREKFTKSILKKTSQQLTAFWGRQIFTGKAMPPKQLNSEDQIKALIAKNPSTIGYLSESMVDDTVKVILKY